MLTDELWREHFKDDEVACKQCVRDVLGRSPQLIDLRRGADGAHVGFNFAYLYNTAWNLKTNEWFTAAVQAGNAMVETMKEWTDYYNADDIAATKHRVQYMKAYWCQTLWAKNGGPKYADNA